MTLALVVAAPLAGAIFLALFGGYLGRRTSGTIAAGAILVSFGAAAAMAPVLLARGGSIDAPIARWLPIPGADFHLVLDVTMLAVVLMITAVSALIAIYSIGYLAGDRGIQRYFAALDLFVAAMLLIAVASNLLLLFAGWELVGLCSYLLIGHWRERPAAATAAVKAFVINRIGDAAFLVGIFLVITGQGTVEIASIGQLSITTSVLILGGALAKSAQLPLHTWLPDAMEGPTPVSALIHAATMVTAGVVLLIRIGGPLSDDVMLAAAIIGAITALGAATVATAQTDLKRVLAWSTISQVGLMFTAAGVGAIFAALFHLVSHALFKASLFLGAGSVLHATQDEIDIRRLGGMARRTPWTAAGFVAGALGLAAIPPAAGFFSKEAIAAAALDRPYLLVLILLTSAVSAFYAARLVTLVFLTSPRSDRASSAHEPGAVMLLPLVGLALGTMTLGLAVAAGAIDLGVGALADAPPWLGALSLALAVAAVLAGWLLYRGGPRDETVLALARSGYGIDALYGRTAVPLFEAIARALELGAERTNGMVLDLVARTAMSASSAARRVQGGYLRAYETLLLAGAVALLAYWSIR